MSPIQRAANQWRRAGLYLFAASFLIGAALWVRLVDDEPFMPLAWPALWVLAGMSVAAFTAWPRSERLYRLAGAAAFDYMMLIGTVIGGWQLARGALAALDELNAGAEDKPFLQAQVVMAKFYAEHVLPRCTAYAAAVQAGSASKMASKLSFM